MTDRNLPVSEFSTSSLPAAAQFTAWRAGNEFMFDILPPEGVEPRGFQAEARTYHLGHMLIGQTQFDAQRYTRDARRIGADRLDTFLVRLHLSGGHTGTNGKQVVEVRAGDIDVIDMAQPIDYAAARSNVIVLGIPRPMMEAALSMAPSLHGFVLRGDTGLGALLGDYLRSLMDRLPRLTVAEADSIASATVSMIAACLRPAHERLMAAGGAGPDALLAEVKAYIEENLRSRELSAELLTARFHLSRTFLYRMFRASGGVHRYIRDRRLVTAFVALADAAQRHRAIGEIAFDLSFASESHFARLFRAAFGCTPGQVRDLPRLISTGGPADQALSAEPVYAGWLKNMAARDQRDGQRDGQARESGRMG